LDFVACLLPLFSPEPQLSSGVSALATALLISKRKGYGKEQFIPHNLPMTVIIFKVLDWTMDLRVADERRGQRIRYYSYPAQ